MNGRNEIVKGRRETRQRKVVARQDSKTKRQENEGIDETRQLKGETIHDKERERI